MVSSLLAMFFFSVTETTQERKVYLAPSLSEWPIVAETAWYRGQLELWWQKCVAASHSTSVVRKPRDECWSSHHFGASALEAVLPVFQGINLSGNTPRTLLVYVGVYVYMVCVESGLIGGIFFNSLPPYSFEAGSQLNPELIYITSLASQLAGEIPVSTFHG